MAPHFAPMASKMDSNAFDQLFNKSRSSHHHHHHFGHDDGFSGGNGTGSDNSGNGGNQSFFLTLLNHTSQQHRMAIIVTSAFSILAAMIVLYTIVHDAYRVQPGQVYSRAQKQSSIFKTLHPAEVFPFIIGIAIIIQGFIFIAVQAGGLGGEFEVSGCRLTSELVFPAIFIVFIVILAFSLETTVRALLRPRFQPRGRYNTMICLAAVFLVLLALWIITYLNPALDICPGSLSWWTMYYSNPAIGVGAAIILFHLVSGVTITLLLCTETRISMEERIAASRIVYTMAINVVVITLLLPFWIQSSIGDLPHPASDVADIGVTLMGMFFAAMHIFARANAERIAIRPKNMPWTKNQKLRLFGSSGLPDRSLISAPLLEPKLSVRTRAESPPIRQVPNEPPPGYADAVHTSPVIPRDLTAAVEFERPLPPQPAQLPRQTTSAGFTMEAHPGTPVMTGSHRRNLTNDSAISEFSEAALGDPPAPLFARRRERLESSYTSASIEIGLRLSGPIPELQSPQELPTRAFSGFRENVPDLEKNLPIPPRPEAEPLPVKEALPEPVKSMPPPTNVGIGALGQGPKGGLKPMLNQPQRKSPLANMEKVWTPSPTEKPNPFSPSTSSTRSERSPQNLSPPAHVGLPRSPSPRARSQDPATPQLAGSRAESEPQSAGSSQHFQTQSPQSPREWPSWPAGNEVNLPPLQERRWA